MRIIQKEITVKSLLRNINLLNLILFLAIIFLFYFVYWFVVPVNINLAAPLEKNKTPEKLSISEDLPLPSPIEYTVVSEKNLFHPERKIPQKENKEKKPLQKPDLVLYGTLITDNVKIAYMEDLKDPHSTPGRGKRQIALRKGDKLNGYTLKHIDEEKVLMVRGKDELVISLFDPDRPVRSSPAVSKAKTSKAAQERITSRKGPKLRRNPAHRNMRQRLPTRR